VIALEYKFKSEGERSAVASALVDLVTSLKQEAETQQVLPGAAEKTLARADALQRLAVAIYEAR